MSHIDLNHKLRLSKILNPLSLRPQLAGNTIVLGYGTVLAKVIAREGLWHAELFDDEALGSMVLAAYGEREDPAPIVRAVKAAAHHLLLGNRQGGEEALLASRSGLLDATGAERLFAIDILIKSGTPPRDALAKILPPLSIAKFDADEPRDERGRWTAEADLGRTSDSSADSDAPVNESDLILATAKTKGHSEAEKEKFTDDHLAGAQALADRLHVPVENVLGLAALESDWGTNRYSINGGNNYLSLHYPAPKATGFMLAGESNALVATFHSFDDCADAFYRRYGHLVDGVSDPAKFAAILQNAGLYGIYPDGSKNPTFPSDVAKTARGFVTRVARRRA